jgi:hypothetical protein
MVRPKICRSGCSWSDIELNPNSAVIHGPSKRAIAEVERPPTVPVFNLLKVLEDLVSKKGSEQPTSSHTGPSNS